MSRKNVLTWLTALLLAIQFAPAAFAQEHTPFIDPEYFDPDYQFFAPADLEKYEDSPELHTGFFFTYDRMYVNVGRPEGAPSLNSGVDGDFTWGNRFDMGFMTNDESGWLITITHIDGPNQNFVFAQERLDRNNTNATDPVLADRNPRSYDIVTSINDADLQTFELCKSWRRSFHNGGVMEPFAGVRFSTFRDRFRRDSYGRFEVNAAGFPDLAAPNAQGPSEVYVTNQASSENTMLGGQFGLRYFKSVSRWTLSSELRMFALQNWQNFDQTTRSETTVYGADPAVENTAVAYILVNETLAQSHGSQFVWGGELRGEATYVVTRDISLRAGFTMTDFARGLGRGNAATQQNSQDLFMGGLTFGVAVNR